MIVGAKITFTCPNCGKQWEEEQDENDEWFSLTTIITLCEECTKEIIKEKVI